MAVLYGLFSSFHSSQHSFFPFEEQYFSFGASFSERKYIKRWSQIKCEKFICIRILKSIYAWKH